MNIQYLKTDHITGNIEVLTGLRIGAGRDAIEIGGIDNPIVRHPHTQRPYIPGSSIKGKMRSLLEWLLDCIEVTGEPYGTGRGKYSPDSPVLRIFGTAGKDWTGGPTRLIVRDAEMNREWANQKLQDGLPLTEDKTEVVINRISGKAADAGARVMERVPSGAIFNLDLSFRHFATDGDGGRLDRDCLAYTIFALRLIQEDALGGSGSRGYGRVRFTNLALNGKSVQAAFSAIQSVEKGRPPAGLLPE
jgi:CRISPR-associated protein Csm3